MFLVGQLPVDALDEGELDRILGSMFAYVEQFFRPALRIGFASHFTAEHLIAFRCISTSRVPDRPVAGAARGSAGLAGRGRIRRRLGLGMLVALAGPAKELHVRHTVRGLRRRPHPRGRRVRHDRRRRERASTRPHTTRPRAVDDHVGDDGVRRPPSPRWTRTRRPGPRRSTSPSTTSRTGWESAPHEEDEDADLITTCSEFDLEELSLADYNTDDFSTGDLSANDGQSIRSAPGSSRTRTRPRASWTSCPRTTSSPAPTTSSSRTSARATSSGEVAAREFERHRRPDRGLLGPARGADSATGETVTRADRVRGHPHRRPRHRPHGRRRRPGRSTPTCSTTSATGSWSSRRRV